MTRRVSSMVLAAVLLPSLAAHASPAADEPTSDEPTSDEKYVGASVGLTIGLGPTPDTGFAVQVAPRRYLEIEAGAIRHHLDAEGDAMFTRFEHEVPKAWVVTSTVRLKTPVHRGAVFVGFGVATGEHVESSGCAPFELFGHCGDEDAYVMRHWKRALWLLPEVGFEVATGPVAFRAAVGPQFQLLRPDEAMGCVLCDDGKRAMTFTLGLHGRIPL